MYTLKAVEPICIHTHALSELKRNEASKDKEVGRAIIQIIRYVFKLLFEMNEALLGDHNDDLLERGASFTTPE